MGTTLFFHTLLHLRVPKTALSFRHSLYSSVTAVVLCLPGVVQASDYFWDPSCTSHQVTDPACWTPIGTPVSLPLDNYNDHAFIEGGQAILSGTDVFTPGYTHVGYNSSGSMLQTGGSHEVGFQLTIGVYPYSHDWDASGSYELQAGDLVVGTQSEILGTSVGLTRIGYYNDSALFTQTGGTHTIYGGLLLGTGPSATASYYLHDGILTAETETIGGVISGGGWTSGDFIQTGGTNNVVGTETGGAILSLNSGTYQLQGGTLNTGRTAVGQIPGSSFIHSGGTHTTGTLSLGNLYVDPDTGIEYGSGLYQLSGTGDLQTRVAYIGDTRGGTLEQSGGTHTVQNDLLIGHNAGVSGGYTLSGGTLTSPYIAVGEAGSGRITQSGGIINTPLLTLGESAGSEGVYYFQGGELTVPLVTRVGQHGHGRFVVSGAGSLYTGDMYLGEQTDGSGELTLTDGTLTADRLWVGYEGSGSVSHVNGRIDLQNMRQLTIGWGVNASGSYQLSSAAFPDLGELLTGSTVVGNSGLAQFEQWGGTHTVSNNLDIAVNSSSVASYIMHDGILSTGSESIGSRGDGEFTQLGGTHTVTGNLSMASSGGSSRYVLSGGSLNVGGGIGGPGIAGVADFEYNGGSLTTNGISVTNLWIANGGEGTAVSYTLQAGAAVNVNLQEAIGQNGNGSFTQLGGTHRVGSMLLGNSGTLYGDGVYRLSDGELIISGDLLKGSNPGGNTGTSTFYYDGGNLSVGGDMQVDNFYLASVAGSNVTHTLEAGNNLVVNALESIGQVGNAQFVHNAGGHIVYGDLQLGGRFSSGRYELNGGTLDVAGNLHIGNTRGQGNFIQNGGDHSVGGDINIAGGLLATGGYTLAGGTLHVAGDFYENRDNAGGGTSTLALDGGTLSVAGLTRVDNLVLGSTSTASGTHRMRATDRIIVNGNEAVGGLGSGEFIQDGGTHQVLGDLGIATQRLSSGRFELNGGTLDVAGNALIGQRGDGTFVQNGGIHTITGNLTIKASSIGSAGAYQLNGGTLNANGGIVNNDRLHIATGAIANVGGSGLTNNGDMTGGGTIQGNLTSYGTIAPGASPGVLTVNGDYTQYGTLAIEIGGLLQGTEYDWLDVNGTATLGGTLDVSLFDFGSGLYDPELGDTFDILTAETIDGEFDLLTMAALGDGLKWDLGYIIDDLGTDVVRLSVSQVPVPAAFWLFGSGLIGLIAMARRNKHSDQALATRSHMKPG